jgi:hypothetical protein
VLNVKYLLHDQPELPNPYPVEGFLPRFRLASDWEIARGSAEVAARLAADDFDPARTVLLEEDPGVPRGGAADASAIGRVVGWEYDGNEITADVEAARPCLLVHAENWFPYWHAFVNGVEVPILRAYGALRAVPVPAGASRVELRFRSVPFERGRAISLAATLGVAAAWAASAIAGLAARRGRRAP